MTRLQGRATDLPLSFDRPPVTPTRSTDSCVTSTVFVVHASQRRPRSVSSLLPRLTPGFSFPGVRQQWTCPPDRPRVPTGPPGRPGLRGTRCTSVRPVLRERSPSGRRRPWSAGYSVHRYDCYGTASPRAPGSPQHPHSFRPHSLPPLDPDLSLGSEVVYADFLV